jgi:hypothetical protein
MKIECTGSYTEIPTNLLVDAHDLIIHTIKDAFDTERNWDDDLQVATVTISAEYMEQLQPLIKWLEYICATWGTESEREASTHRCQLLTARATGVPIGPGQITKSD